MTYTTRKAVRSRSSTQIQKIREDTRKEIAAASLACAKLQFEGIGSVREGKPNKIKWKEMESSAKAHVAAKTWDAKQPCSPEIDPSVPALLAGPSLVVALKSGNFGAEDFFEKADEVSGG